MGATESQRRSANRSRRKEDCRFLTGAGQYTDDVVAAAPDLRRLPALAARARAASASIDTATREGRAGRRRHLHRRRPHRAVNGLPCGWLITSNDGTPMKEPRASGARARQGAPRRRPASRWSSPRRCDQAKDAAELIDVDYEVLPAVVDLRAMR